MLDSLQDYRVIISIYETLSLTLSSEQFNITPATMSKKLSLIEDQLGKKLFYRTTRSMRSTVEGDSFYQHAIDTIQKVNDFYHHEYNSVTGPNGILRITASSSFSGMHLQPIINKFLETYPKIKIDLHLSDNMVNIVEEGFDFAIRIASLKESSLICKKIGDGRRSVCASSSYVKKYGYPKKPSDLIKHNCIVLGNSFNWSFEKSRKDYNVKVDGNLKVDFGEQLVQSVKSGLGIGILSHWHVSEQIKNKEIVTLLDDYSIKNQPDIYLVYPQKKYTPLKNKVFIDFISQNLKLP